MSASLLVDLGNTCELQTTVNPANGVGSTPASGVIIGRGIDLKDADTYCNLVVAGGASVSGQCQIQVQCADADVSGSYTDPMSGLLDFPSRFLSGGIMIVNSGNGELNSGGLVAGAFQRTGRFARAVVLSGDQFNAPITVGFVTQKRTTGSGAGYSFSPGSGVVSV